MRERWDFSQTGWSRVALTTGLGIIGCMAVSLLCVAYTTQFMAEMPRRLSFFAAVIIPVFLSGPICYFFASKLRELAIAHYQLTIIASQDSLTTCLNRGAFITLVDAYLSQLETGMQDAGGALLVVDADHFKGVNDQYGHAAGDDALRKIASVLKGELRGATDLLGRIGGEEFAIFLPGVDRPLAVSIAERLRRSVNGLALEASKSARLSISVGGVSFHGPVSLDRLFASADALLYDAKHRGRNRVEFSDIPSDVALVTA